MFINIQMFNGCSEKFKSSYEHPQVDLCVPGLLQVLAMQLTLIKDKHQAI